MSLAFFMAELQLFLGCCRWTEVGEEQESSRASDWCQSGRGRVGSVGFVLHWKNFTCAVKDSRSVLPTQKSEEAGGVWLVGISLSSIIHTMRPFDVNVMTTQRRNPLREIIFQVADCIRTLHCFW